MKTLLKVLLIAMMPVVTLSQELAKGPKSGSVPGGVTVTTDIFSAISKSTPKPFVSGRPHRGDPVVSETESRPQLKTLNPIFVEDNASTVDDAITRPLILEDFEGIPDQGVFPPPDPVIAVGPDHIMACVNTRFRIWDKDGTVLKTIEASDWFSELLPSQWVMYNPKVRYDHFDNRWLMVWLIDDGTWKVWGDTSYFLISVSDDSDPLGTWYNWAIPSHTVGDSAAGNIAAYEGVGFDEEALYITSNQHIPPVGNFEYVKIRIFDKSQFYHNDAGSVTWTDFWDIRDPDLLTLGVMQLMPAVTYGSPGQYFLLCSSRNSPGSDYNIFKIINPLHDPSLSAGSILVSQYVYPFHPNQLGGGQLRVGWRLRGESAVVYRDSTLYVVHHIASGPMYMYSGLRYARINPFVDTLMEEVTYAQNGYWYFYPAMMVDQNRNVAITFNRSSTSEYVGAFLTGRREEDPPGLSQSVLVKAGEANFVRIDSLGENRWGDYNGIALDPADEDVIWSFTEYAASPANTWGTWMARIKVIVGAPEPVWPPDDAVDLPVTLTFRWNHAEGSALYHLQVSTDSLFSSITFEDSTVADTSRLVGPLDTILYYWRVRGINNGGPGVWSPVWSFTSAPSTMREVVMQPGWNMVSVPVQIEDYSLNAVFPGAGPFVWHYSHGYHSQPALVPGEGYWLKSESAVSQEITGMPVMAETVGVTKGWNIVGSVSYPLAVGSMGSIPGGIVATGFYCYVGGGGYELEDTINPGCAAWVKVSEDGQLILSVGTAMSPTNRIYIVHSDELPPPPPGGGGGTQAENDVPKEYRLEQNYPDPFNPVTTIRYALPEGVFVRLSVFNLLGQEVRTLVNDIQGPGYKSVSFDAGGLPSGVYTYRISAGTFTDVKRMLLLK